jgi:hypothetical protein
VLLYGLEKDQDFQYLNTRLLVSYPANGSDAKIQVAGFTRGLAITDDTIFIGQSRMRHVLRIPHESSNCCLDGGI